MTFGTWLRQQKDRDDPVGDLARDWIADRPLKDWIADRPLKRHRGRTEEAQREYLKSMEACEECLEAHKQAWEEFREIKEGKGQ